MECYYHPDRDSTDTCAICGKSVCKECGLEIAGKVYCKDCLEKIVGLSLDDKAQKPSETSKPKEPARLNKQVIDEDIKQPQEDYGVYEEPVYQKETPQEDYVAENKFISDDSPYNIKNSIDYSVKQDPPYSKDYVERPRTAPITDYQAEEKIISEPVNNNQDYIYPDHNYENKRSTNLEDKYERYLNDLYFDEDEIPLGEQLAKDEEKYGSLTRKEYKPRQQAPIKRNKEEYDEIEARIRRKLARERGELVEEETSIHNIDYADEKEPMGAIDILLIIILIIITLLVLYYIVYLIILNTSYPTFMDALYGLTNPLNVINNLISK